MPSYDNLKLETDGSVATLTVQRPERLNALDRATFAELADAVDEVRRDPAIRALIVTGAGERAFAAGADIAELAALSPAEALALSARGQEIFRSIELCPKPVVAAVNGYALGGGCELALACHLRVAAEGARFGLPEVKLGLIPGYGGTVRLPRLVGRARALELILGGGMIDAAEAHRIGLVNRVVPAADLLAECRALLDPMLAQAPLALSLALDSVHRGADLPSDAAHAVERGLFGVLFGTEDAREGMEAFVGKRPPNFRGR